MLAGLNFLAVTTAAVTNAFVEAAARHRGARGDDAVPAEIAPPRRQLAELRSELLARSGGPGQDATDTGSSDLPRSSRSHPIRGMPTERARHMVAGRRAVPVQSRPLTLEVWPCRFSSAPRPRRQPPYDEFALASQL